MKKSTDYSSRVLKVNHAGEHGAVNIYAGQILLAGLTARDMIPMLEEFRTHEMRHRQLFGAELTRREQSRCKSYWLCGLGGYCLGAFTGVLGRSAINATTVAVEQVVLKHLSEQLATIGDNDPPASAAIEQIIAEEKLHHDASAAELYTGGFWPRILLPVVAAATESVIWLGMKL